jgi:hypothetical protein
MTPAEMIKVIKAYENEQEIQMSIKNKNNWKTGRIPLWNFGEFDYRVKPKEKFVYQYMYKNQSTNKYYITNEFYTDAFAASADYPSFKIVQRLDYTKQSIKE